MNNNNYNVELDTKILKYLIAIVDENSLSRAADKAYISQPTLSRHLKTMETNLGTPIFVREHNKLVLTDAGKVFVNGARTILHIEKITYEQLEKQKKEQKSNIEIAVQPPWDKLLQQWVTPKFLQKNYEKNLCVNCFTSAEEVVEQVKSGKAEIGFLLRGNTKHASVTEKIAFKHHIVFCGEQSFLPSKKMQFSHLKHESFKAQEQMAFDGYFKKMQSELLLKNKIKMPYACCSNNIQVLQKLIEAGYGNIILPKSAIPKKAENRCITLPYENDVFGVVIYNCNLVPRKTVKEYGELAIQQLKKSENIWC